MSSSSNDNDDFRGLEKKGRRKCDSCGTPVETFYVKKVRDEVSGRFVDEYWCKKCFLDKGKSARKQQEKGR